jgi:hypothetical protein
VRRIVPAITGAALVITLGIGLRPVVVEAAKVDCPKVMSELNSGKKVADVAHDLGVSTSSVYRCRRRAKTSASTAAVGTSSSAAPSPVHAASPSH